MKKVFPLLLVIALACGATAVVLLMQRGKRAPSSTVSSVEVENSLEKNSSKANESARIGKDSSLGASSEPLKQDSKDGATPSATASDKDTSKYSNDPFDYGKTPRVKPDANPAVAAAVEAARTKTHPERLSVLISPKPFDEEEFKRNPGAYTQIAEPGRALNPKQPGENVPVLKAVSYQFVRIKQNESTVLRVQTTPKGVASFSSFDLGRFQNQLTAISVQADDNGIAEAVFSGAPGTINDVHIVCASPMCSGTVRFTVNISKP